MKKTLAVAEGQRAQQIEKMAGVVKEQKRVMRGLSDALEQARGPDLRAVEESQKKMVAACESVSERLAALSKESKGGEVEAKAMALGFQLEEMQRSGELVPVVGAFDPFVKALVFPPVAHELQIGQGLEVFEEEDLNKVGVSRLFLEKRALMKKEMALLKAVHDCRVQVMNGSKPSSSSFMAASQRESVDGLKKKLVILEEQVRGVQAERAQVESGSSTSLDFDFLLRFLFSFWVMWVVVIRLDFHGRAFQKTGVSSTADVRKIVDSVFSRSVDYGGSCSVVLSVRWKPKKAAQGDSKEFDHLLSGVDMGSFFWDEKEKSKPRVGGARGSVAASSVPRTVKARSSVKGTKYSSAAVGGVRQEPVMARIPKMEPRPRATSSFGVGGLGSVEKAKRALRAKERKAQLSLLNRRALVSRSHFGRPSSVPGLGGPRVGFGAPLQPAGMFVKREDQQLKVRQRTRSQNSASFVGGEEARRRLPLKGVRGRFARD